MCASSLASLSLSCLEMQAELMLAFLLSIDGSIAREVFDAADVDEVFEGVSDEEDVVEEACVSGWATDDGF